MLQQRVALLAKPYNDNYSFL